MTAFAWTLPFGATLLGEGQTRFRIWAPAKAEVRLEIDGQPPKAMRPVKDGWFELETACAAGSRYRFGVDEDLFVPDPASRAQSGDVHGWSVVADPRQFSWRHPDWMGRPWEEAVIYEIHAGLAGGYKGVAEALEGLKAIGVTAVELMPVADFPGARNWGYDGVLPFAPDAAYGSPEDLKALIDRAHGLGMMVFLDVVYNHFGPDGNFISSYAPEFFREDAATDWGGAIDFSRPEVRSYFAQNAVYWIMEYRFDGLRFDAVHAISDPGWLDDMAAEVRRSAEPGRHVHLVLENDDNASEHLVDRFDAQWNDDFHHVMHVLLSGETKGYYTDYTANPEDRLARALAEGFIYQGEPSKHRGGRLRGTSTAALSPTAFVNFLQNHDQIGNRAQGERLTVLTDEAGLRAAVALQLLTPAIPLIFMGEEVGSKSPFLYFTDHNEELAKAVREGRRREFASFDGFDGDPARLPDPNDPATFEASRPDGGASASDWKAYYTELLRLRRERLVEGLIGARSQGARTLGPKAVFADWSLGNGSRLSVAVNLGADAVPLAGLPGGPRLFSVGADDPDVLGALSFVAWLEPSS